jgi:phage baseplate assembly protein W
MPINQNTNYYGREAVKESTFSVKSKSDKIYGLKFPFGNLEDGKFLKKASDVELIRSNLKQLLLTRRGERVMLPNFGTNLKNYLMEPLDQALLSQIRREISQSIYKYAPFVDILLLQVFPLESGTGSNGGQALLIKLVCSLKEANNLSFEVKVEIR